MQVQVRYLGCTEEDKDWYDNNKDLIGEAASNGNMLDFFTNEAVDMDHASVSGSTENPVVIVYNKILFFLGIIKKMEGLFVLQTTSTSMVFTTEKHLNVFLTDMSMLLGVHNGR